MDQSFKSLLESAAYQDAVVRTKFETNHPTRRLNIDNQVFKKTKEEKIKLANAKLKNKEELKKYYGKDWKKHLNIPSNEIGKIKIETYQKLKNIFKYSSEKTNIE